MANVTINLTASTSDLWACPIDVSTVSVVAIGAGGGGFRSTGTNRSAGGGGGASAITPALTVTPGTVYPLVVGTGGPSNTNGTDTTFGTTLVDAPGGAAPVSILVAGLGGTGGTGTTTFAGGNGGAGSTSSPGAGGGGGAGSGGAGGVGGNAGATGAAGTGGSGTYPGGAGGAGQSVANATGNPGMGPGGGGGGVVRTAGTVQAGPGADGQLVVSYSTALPYAVQYGTASGLSAGNVTIPAVSTGSTLIVQLTCQTGSLSSLTLGGVNGVQVSTASLAYSAGASYDMETWVFQNVTGSPTTLVGTGATWFGNYVEVGNAGTLTKGGTATAASALTISITPSSVTPGQLVMASSLLGAQLFGGSLSATPSSPWANIGVASYSADTSYCLPSSSIPPTATWSASGTASPCSAVYIAVNPQVSPAVVEGFRRSAMVSLPGRRLSTLDIVQPQVTVPTTSIAASTNRERVRSMGSVMRRRWSETIGAQVNPPFVAPTSRARPTRPVRSSERSSEVVRPQVNPPFVPVASRGRGKVFGRNVVRSSEATRLQDSVVTTRKGRVQGLTERSRHPVETPLAQTVPSPPSFVPGSTGRKLFGNFNVRRSTKTPAIQPFGVNLYSADNNSFEGGVGSWFGNNGTVSSSTAQSATGTHSLLYTMTTAGTGGGVGQYLTVPGPAQGIVYRFSCWVYPSAARTVQAKIAWVLGAAFVTQVAGSFTPPANQWTRITVTAVTPTGMALNQVYGGAFFSGGQLGDTLYIDGAEMSLISYATPSTTIATTSTRRRPAPFAPARRRSSYSEVIPPQTTFITSPVDYTRFSKSRLMGPSHFGRSSEVIPPQLNPPITPATTRPKFRMTNPIKRLRTEAPITQAATPNPGRVDSYRSKMGFLRRSKAGTITPTPPQFNPPFPTQGSHSTLRKDAVRRGRLSTPVPPQINPLRIDPSHTRQRSLFRRAASTVRNFIFPQVVIPVQPNVPGNVGARDQLVQAVGVEDSLTAATGSSDILKLAVGAGDQLTYVVGASDTLTQNTGAGD